METPENESQTSPKGFMLKLALSFIDNEAALNTEGLFRVSGRQTDFHRIKDAVARGSDIPKDTDVHVVALLITDTLKNITFPSSFVTGMVELVNDEGIAKEEKQSKTVELFKQLPLNQQRELYNLLEVLQKVVEKSDQNKMHQENLNVVIAPNLFPVNNVNNVEHYRSLVNASRGAFNLLCDAFKSNPQQFSNPEVRFE